MNVDYTAARFWFDIAHWVALIALGVWGYLRTKDNDNASAVKLVATELTAFIKASSEANEMQNTRLTVLEEAVKHMPTDQEVQRIAEDVSAMKARQEGQGELLKRIEHQTTLIQQHLMTNNR